MESGRQRMIFVNLPVRNLKASMAFFAGLGFTFDMRFTDEKAACMNISDMAKAMLLEESFFQTFIPLTISDTRKHTEVLLALDCDSREEVSAMVARALELGGQAAMPSQDHGFMFSWSFYDLDHHHWEVLWMDPNAPMLQQ